MDKRKVTNNLSGDIWTGDDDLLLAETVLRFVREGKTIIEACREMEVITEGRRTVAASKYRWFTKLVDQYQAGYELAKTEGEQAKKVKKRKINKGERYEELVKEVFDEKAPAVEKEIEPEDFVILAKRFKHQQSTKDNRLKTLEKELKAERIKSSDLAKQLKETKAELVDTVEMLKMKQTDYNNMLEALNVLKKAGIQIAIPEPSKPKYKVNKSGMVETIESP